MTKEKKPGRTGSRRRTKTVAGQAVKKCPACGKLVIDGWKVCPVCGAGLDPGAVRRA